MSHTVPTRRHALTAAAGVTAAASLAATGLTAAPARLARVAAKIRSWEETPGRGAGVLVDMTQPSRKRRAARYA
ncbi:hypothetical protein [Streptomyces sp. NPDC002763]|uniref:hypothetical protein n=1 Tax=Streptomyces sp. NPDC002763 TaxID=3154427 RepID=UPI00332D5A13